MEGESLGAGANLNITEGLLKVKAGSGSGDGTWRASERESLKDGGRKCFPRKSPEARLALTVPSSLQQSGVNSFCPLPFYPRSKKTQRMQPPLSPFHFHREGQATLRIFLYTSFPLNSGFWFGGFVCLFSAN